MISLCVALGFVWQTETSAVDCPILCWGNFAKFTDRYLEARFAMNPTEATGAGFHDRDAQLEEWSRDQVTRRIAELHALLDPLGRTSRDGFNDEIDPQILDAQIRAELLDLETLRAWETHDDRYRVGVLFDDEVAR